MDEDDSDKLFKWDNEVRKWSDEKQEREAITLLLLDSLCELPDYYESCDDVKIFGHLAKIYALIANIHDIEDLDHVLNDDIISIFIRCLYRTNWNVRIAAMRNIGFLCKNKSIAREFTENNIIDIIAETIKARSEFDIVDFALEVFLQLVKLGPEMLDTINGKIPISELTMLASQSNKSMFLLLLMIYTAVLSGSSNFVILYGAIDFCMKTGFLENAELLCWSLEVAIRSESFVVDDFLEHNIPVFVEHCLSNSDTLKGVKGPLYKVCQFLCSSSIPIDFSIEMVWSDCIRFKRPERSASALELLRSIILSDESCFRDFAAVENWNALLDTYESLCISQVREIVFLFAEYCCHETDPKNLISLVEETRLVEFLESTLSDTDMSDVIEAAFDIITSLKRINIDLDFPPIEDFMADAFED